MSDFLSESQRRETWDVISLESFQVPCIMGVYPTEEARPQGVRLDLHLHLDTRPAVRHQSLQQTVDYDALTAEVRFILQEARFRLIETAAEALSHYLLSSPPGVVSAPIMLVDVALKKPEALSGHALAGVRIRRDRSEYLAYTPPLAVDGVTVIHASADCLILIRPEGVRPSHLVAGQSYAEMPLPRYHPHTPYLAVIRRPEL